MCSLFRVSLALKNSEVGLNGGVILGHALEVGIKFDQHRIITLEKLIGQFPHEISTEMGEGEGEGEGEKRDIRGRGLFKERMLQEENHLM